MAENHFVRALESPLNSFWIDRSRCQATSIERTQVHIYATLYFFLGNYAITLAPIPNPRNEIWTVQQYCTVEAAHPFRTSKKM